ncbi:AraC family transcriptional regulator [uncultured Roseobacter sp.]|uniref:helix-turn-helix domain-containing protein n=1 Tax=uncultured Roseobacter sp. TaxID=114847 RepID=UPI00262CC2E9|nr:AraC family transcriptional regulator [uncultured Roseobacter sp.]
MISLPLPILTALFLGVLFFRIASSKDRWHSPLLLLTLGLYSLQSVFIGIRWTFSEFSPFALIIVSVIIPPMTWLTLNSLVDEAKSRSFKLHILAIILLVSAVYVAALTDYVVVAEAIGIGVYTGYGLLILISIWRSQFSVSETQNLNILLPSKYVFYLVGGMFLMSAIVDSVIALDLEWNTISISPMLVGYGNLVMLCFFVLIFLGGESRYGMSRVMDARSQSGARAGDGTAESEQLESVLSDETYQELVADFDRLMTDVKLYRKESLSLNQLSRKLGVPSRKVSTAINSIRGMNVPQYVNTFRIAEACDLLEQTDTSVTEIIYETGFTTKSNFHREFQRITGFSPSAWREKKRKMTNEAASQDDKCESRFAREKYRRLLKAQSGF